MLLRQRSVSVNTLPQNLTQQLLDQPETADDLHIVSLRLANGRKYDDVAIMYCSLVAAVRGHAFVPFDGQDAIALRVTHRRWGYAGQLLDR
jgi:hypothetical protein